MRRPLRLIAAGLVAATLASIVAVAPAPDQAAAAGSPPACPWSNTYQRYCNRYTTAGPVGSIGLVGDSVLLGSADGASNPGLPNMLAAAGWGPINLVATLGMKPRWTADNNVSGVYWVKRWHDYGFHPDVIAVNLGANWLGTWNAPTCTPTNTSSCATQIGYMLDTIAQYHPTARIWWAKVNHEPFGAGNGYSLGMLGFNKALDDAAATHPNLILWDWPNALLTANPTISMDSARVHPSSASQYVKRSTLMRDHITTYMPWSTYTGPRAPLPAAAAAPMGYSPLAPTVLFDSHSLPDPVLPASTTTEIDVSALPETAEVATVMVATDSSASNGYLTAWRCGDPRPTVSSLNFAAGVPRAAQALVRISETDTICVFNSAATAVTVYSTGWLGSAAALTLSPITPLRAHDTRNTGIAAELEVAVPSAGAVAATVTVTGASSGGTVALTDCSETGTDLPVLKFQPGETAAGATFATEWTDGTLCLEVTANSPGELPHVIVDVTATLAADGDWAFVPASATRLLDTRSALGGWVGRHGYDQVIDILAAPPGAQAVTGTITIVKPMSRGRLTAFACDESLPPTSSVNAAAETVMANSITIAIDDATQTLCIHAYRRTDTLFDVVGWWVVPPLAE